MNRVKLSITNESGQTLCKIGTSIPAPRGAEYTDQEIADLLRELSCMLSSKTEHDEFLNAPSVESWESEPMTTESLPVDEAEQARLDALVRKWAFLFEAEGRPRNPTAMLIESQETPLV